MHAVALALVLVAGQSDDFFTDEEPQKPSRIQDVRAGGGGAALVDLGGSGVGMNGEAGLEFKPWGPVALRLSLGSTMKIGWGSFYFAPEVVYRFRAVSSTLSPYVAAGGNAALVSISDETLGIERLPTIYTQQAHAATGNDANPPPAGDGADGPSGIALQFSVSPQAAVGLRWQAFRKYALDFGARWSMLRFDGKTYQSVGAFITVCAPG